MSSTNPLPRFALGDAEAEEREVSSQRLVAAITAVIAISLLAMPSSAQPAPDTPPESSAAQVPDSGPRPDDAEVRKKEVARRHFEKGLSLYDAGAWDAALAEFLLSRGLYPTRAATKNASLCFRRLYRFDEALEMLERLLAFPELTSDERQWTVREHAEVSGLVGAVVVDGAEPGATITIDGRTRGTTPTRAPFRVAAGSHVVRAYKPGFESAEVHVDVAGGQAIPVRIQLAPLVQSGWLKVDEVAGKVLDVVVDNAVVGQTPWRGLVPPGEHVVFLRGEGRLGTQPASVPVRLNQVTPLILLAEELSATLRVEPTPAGASVIIDGVRVGRGFWEGALRPGVHRIELAAEGFATQVQDVALRAHTRETVRTALEPIPGPPLWWVQSRFFVEMEGYFGIVPGFGGDAADGCSDGCSTLPGIALAALGRAGYRLPSGILLAVEAGYLSERQAVHDRTTTVNPTGLEKNRGKADDTLTLRGALLGVSPGLRLGDRVPLTFGIGIGAFLGTLEDRRTGSFTPRSGVPYHVEVTEAADAQGMYIAPEVRLRVRLVERLELGAGVRALVVVFPTPPRWLPEDGYVTAGIDGQGQFPNQSLSSHVVIAVAPGIAARYEF